MHFKFYIFSMLAIHLYAANLTNPDNFCEEYGSKIKKGEIRCDLNENDDYVVCFNGFDQRWKSESKDKRGLIFCNWPEARFDLENILRGFPLLEKLILVGGNLTELQSSFPEECRHLESIHIIGTDLRRFAKNVFSNLPKLQTLDLRNNSIKEIDLDVFNISSLQHVDFSGNPLRCTEDLAWILDATKQESLANKIVDKERLRCTSPFDGRPLLPVVEIIVALKKECEKSVCDCELVYIVARGGMQTPKQLMAFTSVNCSSRGLTEMPDFLPDNTTTLRLTGNKISNLKPLVTNPVYKSVLDLYLDENRVESIAQLEGSHWLDHFRLLSLRGNKLSDLPTYALENVLLHSRSAASLYLGNNPWTCDCLFTPGFQDLLIRYPNIIKDTNDIRCASINGDDKSNKQIRDLTRTEICVNPDEEPWLHPLDVLNVVLATLIFLVLGKLLYDYWCFKKTGKLPWIVAKIP